MTELAIGCGVNFYYLLKMLTLNTKQEWNADKNN